MQGPEFCGLILGSGTIWWFATQWYQRVKARTVVLPRVRVDPQSEILRIFTRPSFYDYEQEHWA